MGKINGIYSFVRKDKAFVKKTIAIAVPIALQALMNNALNLVDTLMIGTLGETSIAAVGLANKVFFVFTLLVFGICSGSGILTAQYWGKRDITNIRRVLGMSLILGLAASLFFLVPALAFPEKVMRIFTPGKETIAVGAAYLGIVALSYPVTVVTNAYVALLRSVNEVKAPLVITVVSICVNVLLNYIFIFGRLGLPAMGVAGAALATLIARFVEGFSLLAYVYIRKGPAAAKLKELLSFPKEFLKRYFSTVTPVILNEFMWALGVTMYSLVYGRMGDGAVAAITITQTVEQVVMVLFQGISNATAVLLGNEMGGGHLKDAKRHAKNLVVMQMTVAVGIMILCFFLMNPMVQMFDISPAVQESVKRCFMVFIAFVPFKAFAFVLIVGILRSGGDTKAALFLDTTGVWLIGIPMAFIGGMLLQLPIHWVYAMVMLEELYKASLGLIRYRQKKWLRNLVED